MSPRLLSPEAGASARNHIIYRGNHRINWLSCGVSTLVELELSWRCWFLWRREPGEKPSEQDENQQQTRPTYGTTQESNGHLWDVTAPTTARSLLPVKRFFLNTSRLSVAKWNSQQQLNTPLKGNRVPLFTAQHLKKEARFPPLSRVWSVSPSGEERGLLFRTAAGDRAY